jgi:hypothetical protein
MAGPQPLYYLAIDGTEAQDSAVFGALLEGRGWKNLASTFLKPAPDDPSRLVDPAHDFLPIPLVEAKGKKVAVVSPTGTHAKGKDRFWASFSRQSTDVAGTVVRGRRAAAELSALFARQLILRPGIHTHELQPDQLSRHFADERLPYASSHAPAARILYVSTHGLQSGTMVGEFLSANPDDQTESQDQYFPHPYFRLGDVAADGGGFHGPEWIVLAQCSTLNASSWSTWARVLARSSPGVRGILGYEEGSPNASASVTIAGAFFGCLDRGSSFLESWAEANGKVQWAALVHKEARADTLADLARRRPLSDVRTTKDLANYYGFRSSMASGKPVHDTLPPFFFKLEHQFKEGTPLQEVAPDASHMICRFTDQHLYRLTVQVPDARVSEVSITIFHLRETLRGRQIPWSSLFSSYEPAKGVKLDGFSTTTVILRPEPGIPATSWAFEVHAGSAERAGLEVNHSYLWFRITARTDAGLLHYDFKSQGLYY